MRKDRGLKKGDFVYITYDAASRLPHLKGKIPNGGMVEKVEREVAEVHVTTVERIHVSMLTTAGDDAYDPIL